MGVLLDQFGIGDALARAESWRYSAQALRALEQQGFVEADPGARLPPELVERFDWPETRGRRVVFVNGTPHDGETTWSKFRLTGGRLADGECLHLVFINVPGERATRWQRDFVMSLDNGSAEIIEQHIGASGAEVLGELKSQLQLGQDARLSMTTISDLPDSASLYRREAVLIGGAATYASTHALFGGRLQRFDLNVGMQAEHARYSARGVFTPRGRQHVDVHLDARHAVHNTQSDVSWRGVADQRGRGILHGAITVAPGADGADAQLQTRNLLLSAHAEIDAQPVLEIYADEVKAAHGATVGQLDERALFYLRSRGIPLAHARNLLIAAFCREALDGVGSADLRARLDAMLSERLPQTGQGNP